MEARTFWLLVVVVLALGSSSSTGQYVGLSANQCAVPAKDRVDCGYPEVTPEQCNNRGCCFDSSIHGVPWCFKPLQEADLLKHGCYGKNNHSGDQKGHGCVDSGTFRGWHE
ncbi:hypothetical protein E5288_WYG011048 [Bos mutus]|uniref:Trefoil factor 3 n=1 Tax=Bos mutus TaxID=72004 RepID=A0A6B0QXM7_9CETA|nr:hypothetical protein [Bos mutus]